MKLPGEMKRVVFIRPFEFDGKQMTEGDELEIEQAECYDLWSTMRKPAFRLLHGGVFNITRMLDGYHRIDPWYWPGYPQGFSTSDRFVKIQFLKDNDWFLCKTGDKRRLRLSIVREFPHKYLDSAPPSPSCTPRPPDPIWLIHENRPRPAYSDDDLASREIAAARREAMQAPSWIKG